MQREEIITQVAVIGGAGSGGAMAWIIRPANDRRLFLAAAVGVWVAVAITGAVRGELTLRGRRGPAKRWSGAPARLGGASIAAVGLLILAAVMYA